MKCINCKDNDAVKYSEYSNGKFCSRFCAKSFSTKKKRKEINEKVSKTLKGTKFSEARKRGISGKNNWSYKTGEYSKVDLKGLIFCCELCNGNFSPNRKSQRFCSIKCSRSYSYDLIRKRMDENERNRLKEIGRKGGFGKKGYTDKGVYYQSLFEKNCFEFLDEIKIKYTPHKDIPNSSKISDLFIDDMDLWIELDGIDREKRKEWLKKDYEYWLEKLEIYKRESLKLLVIKTVDDFKKIFQ